MSSVPAAFAPRFMRKKAPARMSRIRKINTGNLLLPKRGLKIMGRIFSIYKFPNQDNDPVKQIIKNF